MSSENKDKDKDKDYNDPISEVLGRIAAIKPLCANYVDAAKSAMPKGFGVAVEQANTYVDVFMGRVAEYVGHNNKKNGPDRIVYGQLIQTKYCSSGAKCVAQCFDKRGNFRYFSSNGRPMQIEVPRDKYNDAVKALQARIAKGLVKGVSDPKDAYKIIRRGHLTYDQAVNLGRFGTVESLTFDAVTGLWSASGSAAISALSTFAAAKENGEKTEDASRSAAIAGVKQGGAAFATNVTISQIARSKVDTLLTPLTKKVVQVIGAAHVERVAALKQVPASVVINQSARALRGSLICVTVATATVAASETIAVVQQKKTLVEGVKNTMVQAFGASTETAAALLTGALLTGTAVASGPVGAVVVITLSISAATLTGMSTRYGAEKVLDIVIPANGIDEMLVEFVEDIAEACNLTNTEKRVMVRKCFDLSRLIWDELKASDLVNRAQICLDLCTTVANQIIEQRQHAAKLNNAELTLCRRFHVASDLPIINDIVIFVLTHRGWHIDFVDEHVVAASLDGTEVEFLLEHAHSGTVVIMISTCDVAAESVQQELARLKGQIHDYGNRQIRDVMLNDLARDWPFRLLTNRKHYDVVR